MIRWMIPAIAALLWATSIYAQTPSAVPPGYILTFQDFFPTADVSMTYPPVTPDGNKWYLGPSNALNCCMDPSTGTAASFYTNGSNGTTWPFSVVPGGGLDITLNYFPSAPGGATISSGSISTWPAFSQQYGYWEVVAQFPAGLGVWPAIWMLPVNGANNGLAGGEIDIQEGHSIASTPTQMSITLHDYTSSTNPVPGYFSINVPTTDTYHAYGMLWTAELMTFYFDNQPVWSFQTPAVMNTPYYLILDLGIGSGWPSGPGITPFPQDMLIKSVRVFQAPSITASNSFPTANGSMVPGVVMMCLTAGKATPCTGTVTAGPDSEFSTAGGAPVGGLVQMCLTAGKAMPCAGTVTSGPDSSFTTPGNARVGGTVLMCLTGGVAVPCSGAVVGGPDGSFTTPGGGTIGGAVRMCVAAGIAAPC